MNHLLFRAMEQKAERQISNTIDSILASKPTDERELSVAEVQGRKHLLALSENVISLIWCLAEASHKTLAAVNGAHVEGLLIKVVEGRELVGPGVVLAAGASVCDCSSEPLAR